MANEQNNIPYLYEGSDTTVEQFLSGDVVANTLTKTQFLNFKIKGKTNLQRIWENYDLTTEQTDTSLKSLYSAGNLSLLKKNTLLYIPISAYREQLLSLTGKNLFLDQNKELIPYFSEKQLELESDPEYLKVEQVTKQGRHIDVQIIEENCQVWVYCKALDKILDLSPFIQNLTTQKGEIGSFSFTLSPINAIINRDDNTLKEDLISTFGNEFVNEYEITNDRGLNLSIFDKYFQQNDVVFIRFEKLQLEQNTVLKSGIEVNKSSLPNQIFDMIGLIDGVNSSINFAFNDYTVNVNGRDLTKTIIEDGSYSMPLIYKQGNQNRFFYGGNQNDKYFKRNYVAGGAFDYIYRKEFKSIDGYLGFVINQLSNIGWVDNDLFSAYEGKRTEAYRLGSKEDAEYLKDSEVNGVWQIIKLKSDPQIEDRRVVDETMMDADSTLIEQFKNVCQDPFVHIWGDTYGSQFEFIVRQQPFDAKGMRQIVGNKSYIEIEDKDVYQINLGWEDEYYSWFKLQPSSRVVDNRTDFYDYAFPIVYLEKYVENFGNHKMIIPDNYVKEDSFVGEKGKENKNRTAEMLFNDLKYVLESYSVLPFTRKGTITINGDRRIKRGSFVKLNSTNEIFYVESVSNQVTFTGVSVDRTTTLSVKRGMVERFIKGAASGDAIGKLSESKLSKDEIKFIALQKAKGIRFIGEVEANPDLFSYYDIVNAETISKNLYNRFFSEQNGVSFNSNKTDKLNQTDFTVNEDTFDFFLNRRQFD